MTYGQSPGQDGQQGQHGVSGGTVPPQWRYERQDSTRQLGWYEQQRLERGNGQRAHAPRQPQPHFLPAWPPQPGQRGFGPPPPQPPYQPPPPPRRPPHRPPQRGRSWPARHKALTGFLALVALVIIIAAANSGGSPSSPGSRTTAGLATTASATATGTTSHHAAQATATAQRTQPVQTQPAAPTATHAPAPSAHAPTPSVPALTTPAATAPAATAPAATAPPPAASAAPTGCHPLTNAGNCYEPGEYCRDSDHGVSGIAGDGEPIICEDNDGWRWEPS